MHHHHDHHHCKTPEPHAHSHHSHAPKDYGRIFAFGIILNIVFVIIEALYGWYAHSLALLADAGYNIQLKSALQGLGFAIGFLFLSELFQHRMRRKFDNARKTVPQREGGC